MKNLTYILIALIIISCGGGQTFKTENGTVVTVHRKGADEVPSDSLISYFILKYETDGGKVLYESTLASPSPVKLDSNFFKNDGDFFEVMGKMKVGDSVTYELTASSLFLDNFKGRLPDSVNADDNIKIYAAFVEQVTLEAYQAKALELQQEQLQLQRERMLATLDQEQVAKDVKIIDDYLDANGIEAVKTESGIRYVINEQGNGPRPKLGQGVQVHYAGRLLSGEYFDTSMEDVAKAQGLYNAQRPYQPYPIRVYNSPVITGWHEGIYLLNEGTKATLYIPSSLAYGPRSQGDLIKENSILVFDVELVDVE